MKLRTNPQAHRDAGFTDDEFLEIVEFFEELLSIQDEEKRLQAKREHLINVLKYRVSVLARRRRRELFREITLLNEFSDIKVTVSVDYRPEGT